jgi:hypothetical protein
LVRESVVVLTPDSGGKEDVERGDFGSPFDLEAFLDPFYESACNLHKSKWPHTMTYYSAG